MTGKKKIKHLSAEMVFTYVLAILLLILVLVPFLSALISSFKVADDFYGNGYTFWPSEYRLANYLDAWNFAELGLFLKNSVFCAVVVTVCSTFICAFAAYGFARLHFYGRDFIFQIFIMIQGIPFMVLFVPTYQLLNSMGLVNTLAGLILPQIAFPMGTFLMRQTMMSIPVDYEYAAMMDGCNRFQIFSKIFLPMVSNTLKALAVLSFMQCWNNYIWPLVLISDQKKYTLPIGLTLYTATNSMGRRPEWSVIMAAALLSVLPIMIVYCFASQRLMEGIALGGLKG